MWRTGNGLRGEGRQTAAVMHLGVETVKHTKENAAVGKLVTPD